MAQYKVVKKFIDGLLAGSEYETIFNWKPVQGTCVLCPVGNTSAYEYKEVTEILLGQEYTWEEGKVTIHQYENELPCTIGEEDLLDRGFAECPPGHCLISTNPRTSQYGDNDHERK
jgi:hypothetical protein